MQAQDRQKISPKTYETLMNCVSNPRRLGGHTRAIGIISRIYGGTYKAFFGRDIREFRDLPDFFSSMLEEEAVRLVRLLGTSMPDTSKDTVHETVRRLAEAV